MVIHVDVALTKMSSKGQVVIPTKMRKNLHEGDELLIIQNEDQIIMKKATTLDKNLKEDLAFAKRTEEALHRIEQGKGIRKDFDDFIADMKTW